MIFQNTLFITTDIQHLLVGINHVGVHTPLHGSGLILNQLRQIVVPKAIQVVLKAIQFSWLSPERIFSASLISSSKLI
jgi:hypothetical protein